MSALPYWVVVLARFEKRGSRIDVSFVKDGVSRDGEEVPEGGDDCTVVVQCGGFVIGGHDCFLLRILRLSLLFCALLAGHDCMWRRGKMGRDDCDKSCFHIKRSMIQIPFNFSF